MNLFIPEFRFPDTHNLECTQPHHTLGNRITLRSMRSHPGVRLSSACNRLHLIWLPSNIGKIKAWSATQHVCVCLIARKTTTTTPSFTWQTDRRHTHTHTIRIMNAARGIDLPGQMRRCSLGAPSSGRAKRGCWVGCWHKWGEREGWP